MTGSRSKRYTVWSILCLIFENDSDVTERAQGYTLQDASFMRQSQCSFLNSWENTQLRAQRQSSSFGIRADVTVVLDVRQSIAILLLVVFLHQGSRQSWWDYFKGKFWLWFERKDKTNLSSVSSWDWLRTWDDDDDAFMTWVDDDASTSMLSWMNSLEYLSEKRW